MRTREKILVWIFCREAAGNLFLLLRTKPARGDFWQPVTGSVEEGESVAQAAAREMDEESGLEPLGKLGEVSEPYEFADVREYPFMAEVAAGSRSEVRLDPREHVEFRWVSGEEALTLMKWESNARVLREVMRKLK